MGKREFIVLISMLMALTALAIDMMLPAFAEMRADFGLASDSSGTALVVTAFLIGFGLGQPLWGPLSDALGRKRILWIGLGIYALAAIGAALAPSLMVLLLLRFVAGLGAAAVRIVTLGAIRDRYHGDQMAKILSYVLAIFLLVPMVAPSLGAVLISIGDWRWIFAFFALAALIKAVWSTRLPETLPPERRLPFQLAGLLAALRAVLGSRFTMCFRTATHRRSWPLSSDDVAGLHFRHASVRPASLIPRARSSSTRSRRYNSTVSPDRRLTPRSEGPPSR